MLPKASYVVTIERSQAHHPYYAYRKTFAAGRSGSLVQLPHPENPSYAQGTTIDALLYSLGHDEPLKPLASLQPAHLRHLRHLAYELRQSQGRLHLFGVVDTDSPYGQSGLYEPVLRFMTEAQIPCTIHRVIWHPTPGEYSRCESELATWENFGHSLGHSFSVVSPHRTLHFPSDWHHAIFPLSAVDSVMQLTSADRLLILNHDLHGFHSILDGLMQRCPAQISSFNSDRPLHDDTETVLSHHKPVLVMATKPSYTNAYEGLPVSHPYYESAFISDPVELLSLAQHPEFESYSPPAMTSLLLHDSLDPDFDWLLSTFLRQHIQDTYAIYWLNPQSNGENYLLTNSLGHF